jgi:hypothetical protein
MISRQTVLVLGAGASAPYGFPLGRKLLFEIAGGLEASGTPLSDLLLDLDNELEYEDLAIFRRNLLLSYAPSVDAFLENRPEYMEVGKAAIAATLIPHEVDHDLYRSGTQVKWYEYLFQQMGARRDEFSENHLSVITFNYDRSIEYFFLIALKHRYGLEEEEAVDLLKGIPIVHVYGQLGKPHFLAPDGRNYTNEITPTTIKKCVPEIKILHEGVEDTNEFQRAHELISQAQILCFLGFGYQEVNVRRLKLNEHLPRNCRVLGSAFELETDELKRVEHMFRLISPKGSSGPILIKLGTKREGDVRIIL